MPTQSLTRQKTWMHLDKTMCSRREYLRPSQQLANT